MKNLLNKLLKSKVFFISALAFIVMAIIVILIIVNNKPTDEAMIQTSSHIISEPESSSEISGESSSQPTNGSETVASEMVSSTVSQASSIASSAPKKAKVTSVNMTVLDSAILDTAKYMHRVVKKPQVGSVGGEWAVFGLARSGYTVPDKYYQDYYATVEKYVAECKGELHKVKYTEYSRLIFTLTSIGRDPSNVAGYNLLTPLGDYKKTIKQGLNGPIWALISLDSGNYPIPKNPNATVQATRDMYINRILECQLSDGGFSLTGGTSKETKDSTSDPDITGMALQALAKYQDKPAVKKVTEEALACMSKMQKLNGGYNSWGSENSESCVQVLCALNELGVSIDDPRFVKNGKTILDALMTYHLKGNGFLHVLQGTGSNQMASEQGFYGLISTKRALEGKSSLYRITDPLKVAPPDPNAPKSGEGLVSKNKIINPKPITIQGKTFPDISGVNAHANMTAIETLAAREIISGTQSGDFAPNENVTKAEFIITLVRSLGIISNEESFYSDDCSMYSNYLDMALKHKLIDDISYQNFISESEITRQEAAKIIMRASELCGIETKLDAGQIRDILAQFGDYVNTEESSRKALAFCYSNEILSITELDIKPTEPMKRCEVAQVVFNMLGLANLI